MKSILARRPTFQVRRLYRRILLGFGLVALTTGVSGCSTIGDWIDAINPFS